jgi:hypothetical protein
MNSVGPMSMLVGKMITSQPIQEVSAESVESNSTPDAATSTVATSTQEVKKNEVAKTVTKKVAYTDIKKVVKNYFADAPVLAEIARCESTYRHFDSNGEVLRGQANSRDVGVMQINERYHSARARALGIDIYSLEGNMKYARLLYKEQGSAPWKASAGCWGNQIAYSI